MYCVIRINPNHWNIIFKTFWLNLYCRKLALLYKLIINYIKIALDISPMFILLLCSISKQC